MSTMVNKLQPSFEYLETNLMRLVLEMAEKMQQESIVLNSSDKSAHATPAQIRVFDSLRGKPRTISSLAEKLGISRQATHKTVHQLVDAGLLRLERLSNNRDQNVLFTEEGKNARLHGAKNLIKIEEQVIKDLGEADYQALKKILLKHHNLYKQPKGD